MAKIEIEVPDDLFVLDGVFVGSALSSEEGGEQKYILYLYEEPRLTAQLGYLEAGADRVKQKVRASFDRSD